MNIRDIQNEQKAWVIHNFPGRDSYYPLLGAVEEVGEIAHAHLKMKQGIRGTKKEHLAAIEDGIADVIIFLCDYATAMGIDVQDALEKTWVVVKQRDWRMYPNDGVSK